MGSRLTVLFDGSLWVGVLEVVEADGAVRAARHVFGAEPGAAEIEDFTNRWGLALLDRALAAPAVPPAEARSARATGAANPKRAARQLARERRRTSPSTAAQQALAAAREAEAHRRSQQARERDEAERERRRAAERERRRARHRGR